MNATPKPLARLPDALLLRLVAAALIAIVGWFALRGWLPRPWQVPGSAQLYLTGLAGLALLLVPFAYALGKRGGAAERPVAWFVAHVVCGLGGIVLIAIHSGGHLRRAPALLLAVLVLLVVTGVWGRIAGARRMAGTFGTRVSARPVPDAAARERLRALISEKRRILSVLAPQASESTFSVRPIHLLRQPRLALRYLRCAAEEQRLLGVRASVGPGQAWWRPLHMLLAWVFLIGVLVHVLTVSFFAGWVADYGPVHWWHLTAW